jgi:hypothetical protein
MIRSSERREGEKRPDDLAVAIREEGSADAMVVVACFVLF